MHLEDLYCFPYLLNLDVSDFINNINIKIDFFLLNIKFRVQNKILFVLKFLLFIL